MTTVRLEGKILAVKFRNSVVYSGMFIAVLGCAVQTAIGARLPEESLNLTVTAPITIWDEGIPLGNGAVGVLLWGENNTIRLSLDRGDLWDERPSKAHLSVKDRFNWASMQRMVADNNMQEFNAVFDSNYDYNGSPTKLPAGRLEIELADGVHIESFQLNLAIAEGLARFAGGEALRVFVNAGDVTEPVVIARIPGQALVGFRLKHPDSLRKLGYPPPRTGRSNDCCWFEQECADGLSYAVCAAWKKIHNETQLAIAIATSNDGSNPRVIAEKRIERALRVGYDRMQKLHAKWWEQFWARSSIDVPEHHILQHYYLVRYLYGSASRRGAPPMPLQGVWTADDGSLPPWKGDYHNDLNTQMTYMGYQPAGHFDEGATFLDMLWELLPTFRRFARDFYDAPGAAVPGVMTLKGQALGGWGQYSLSPTMGAWNAHLFYLHWRYTQDNEFLKERAYPWCCEIGECILHLLKPDANGILKLPLSSSPEIFDNTRRAFVTPNSNYDLMCMKILFLALADMAAASGNTSDSAKWVTVARQLGDFHIDADGVLLVAQNTPLPGSHRHLSNLIGIYPFNLITIDGPELDRRVIGASLKQWDALGTSAWCGYSFSWMSALRARVGDAEAAVRYLDIFTRAFVLRNGFHANGDQTKSGFSSFTYRPFTLEGNFLAMAAVHEMLLQSWAPNPGGNAAGIIRLFPSTPWRWHDASFMNLRAEGGHRVSARRENNATTWFRIVAGSDGPLRILDNFSGVEPRWNRENVKKIGGCFEITARKGDLIEGFLPKPAAIPAPPPDLAAPVVPPSRN